MILILTREGDEHVHFVAQRLKEKGAAFVEFHTSGFPSSSWASLHFNCDDDRRLLCIQDTVIDLREVRTVWNRRPMPPEPAAHLDKADHDFIVDESLHAIQSLWRLLRNSFWVNPLLQDLNARYKPFQLEIAEGFGFDIPKTLITNNPREVLSFFECCNGNMIYKCFSNHGRVKDGRGFGIFTSRVERSQLEEHLDQIKLAPCTFQEYVEKKSELRVTVFGRKIFAAEIDSQSQEMSKVDWRRTPISDLGSYSVPQRPFKLPGSLERKILLFMEHLGLVFGCLDFVLTPRGEFVFLEINTNGQWYWIEQVTGMPMLDAFTEMLIQGRSDFVETISQIENLPA